MSLVTEESKQSERKATRPRLSWDDRFVIALASAVLFFWLASLQNPHNLPPLPTFAERFRVVAPTLLACAVGILCLIWLGLLFREAKSRSTPVLISSATAGEAARRKRWTVVKSSLFVVFILATVPSLGGHYFKYLWPAYPQSISHWARPIFDLLAFLGAFAASTRRRRSQKPQPGTGYGDEKGPWLDDRQKIIIAVIVLGVAAIFVVLHVATGLPPATAQRIITISTLAVVAALVALGRSAKKPDSNAPHSSMPHSDFQRQSLVAGETRTRRPKWAGKAAVWIVVLINIAVIASPAPHEIKSAAIYAPLGILIIGSFALGKLKRWAYGLARQGEFDRALRIDRRLARIPGYGTPLEGPILFNAGRYSEARAYVKPTAFDEYGQPRLTSTEFYTYALTLVNEGKEAEAQPLLEAATQAPQRTAAFQCALATCLLSQKKDATRACELMEQALAFPDLQSTSSGYKSDYAMRLARFAWALAACGRRQEAESKLAEAFADTTGLKDRDLAGLQYFAGETWRAMGEWKKARAAFDEALRLSPDGPAATGTKKALAKLRVEADA